MNCRVALQLKSVTLKNIKLNLKRHFLIIFSLLLTMYKSKALIKSKILKLRHWDKIINAKYNYLLLRLLVKYVYYFKFQLTKQSRFLNRT